MQFNGRSTASYWLVAFAQGASAHAVRVKLTGFYDLVPPGEPGNEARLIANVPAAEARPDFKPPQ